MGVKTRVGQLEKQAKPNEHQAVKTYVGISPSDWTGPPAGGADYISLTVEEAESMGLLEATK